MTDANHTVHVDGLGSDDPDLTVHLYVELVDDSYLRAGAGGETIEEEFEYWWAQIKGVECGGQYYPGRSYFDPLDGGGKWADMIEAEAGDELDQQGPMPDLHPPKRKTANV